VSADIILVIVVGTALASTSPTASMTPRKWWHRHLHPGDRTEAGDRVRVAAQLFLVAGVAIVLVYQIVGAA
jgi:hypothetical protein